MNQVSSTLAGKIIKKIPSFFKTQPTQMFFRHTKATTDAPSNSNNNEQKHLQQTRPIRDDELEDEEDVVLLFQEDVVVGGLGGRPAYHSFFFWRNRFDLKHHEIDYTNCFLIDSNLKLL